MIEKNRRPISFKNHIKSAINYTFAIIDPNHSYHNKHKQRALEAVEIIENNNSVKLTRQLKKTADDYAIQVFGKKEYAPWLYVYSLIRGEFKEGWIPDNYFGLVVSPDKGLALIPHYKSFSKVILKTEALPDIAYFVDGVFFDDKYKVITSADLRKTISNKHAEVMVKRDRSARGKGVTKVRTEDISEDYFNRLGNCVIQTPIKQHQFFDEIMPDSVATLRITTVNNLDGQIEFRASYLRVGLKDAEWIQSGKFVSVAIVNIDGELDSYCYSNWKRWHHHPDTHYSFTNKRIPHFNKAVFTCINLHRSVPHFLIIGWDLIINKYNEISLMEWNAGHTGIRFNEATVGPCFTGLKWEQLRKR